MPKTQPRNDRPAKSGDGRTEENKKQPDWRDELTARLLDEVARPIGSEHWRWSIGKRDYQDGHPEDAIFHVTVNLRAVVVKAVQRVETFCRDVGAVGKLTPAEHQQVIEQIAKRYLRVYVGRVVGWLMKAEELLTEVAVSIAATEDDVLRTLARKTYPGDPHTWLQPRVLRRWLTTRHAAFLKKEIAAIRSPTGRRSQKDKDLRLFLRVTELREQLRNAGDKAAVRKASRQAREEFKIPTYENYKKRMNKGRKVARSHGLI